MNCECPDGQPNDSHASSDAHVMGRGSFTTFFMICTLPPPVRAPFHLKRWHISVRILVPERKKHTEEKMALQQYIHEKELPRISVTDKSRFMNESVGKDNYYLH
jgi:hypothetical protein